MNRLKKYFSLAAFFLFVEFILVKTAYAFCPVCTIAVAGGIGLSRWLGVDDTITGLWVGGFTVSLIAWTILWFQKKNIKFYGEKSITILGYYAIIVLPLYWKGIIGHPLNKLWGVDKLLLGIILGSVFFFLGGSVHFALKKRNGEKVYFPFQKIAFSVFPLVVLSFVFYFITRQ